MIDKYFKHIIIALGVIFMFLYYQSSQTNRYQHMVGLYVLDTSKGIIYDTTLSSEVEEINLVKHKSNTYSLRKGGKEK